MIAFREKLPAYSKREELLRQIEENQVLVISGETGCGKTTQVPQFILEDAIGKNKGFHCNIICTQPRRISAISVSDRVASERGERLARALGTRSVWTPSAARTPSFSSAQLGCCGSW